MVVGREHNGSGAYLRIPSRHVGQAQQLSGGGGPGSRQSPPEGGRGVEVVGGGQRALSAGTGAGFSGPAPCAGERAAGPSKWKITDEPSARHVILSPHR